MRERIARPVCRTLCAVAVAVFVGFPGSALAQDTGANVIARLDSAAQAHAANEMIPGVSVAVMHHGEMLLEKGYGSVDLEWGVATPAEGDASYQIGSMTKQFTSTAVLLLAEEGKIDLDADITDYLDFDTGGRRVPVRRLLDHTSGIRSYTEMPVFGALMGRKLPRDTLVREIEATPFDFEPGTAMIYNNSAYFFLGLIIEKVTGMSYEDVIAERLFAPVGMDESYYCSEIAIRRNRAHGYDAAGQGQLIRARYLDHTWPYAAGSLCSTVGDMIDWNMALHGGEILTPESYQALITPAPLKDGTRVRYAMGLGVTDDAGRRLIAHGGGINGFLSSGRFYPDEELIVIVLQNSTGSPAPDALAETLAALVLGPGVEAPPGAYIGDIEALVGEYSGPARGRPMSLVVEVEDGELGVRVNGRSVQHPAFKDGRTWRLGNNEITFDLQDGGAVKVHFDSVGGHYVLARSD